jgi:hypothetical protein
VGEKERKIFEEVKRNMDTPVTVLVLRHHGN